MSTAWTVSPSEPQSVQAWRDHMLRMHPHTEIRLAGREFEVSTWGLGRGGFRIARMDLQGDDISHTLHKAGSAGEGGVSLCIQLSGTGVIVQDDRMAQLEAGDIAIYDESKPYSVIVDGPVSCIGILLPWHLLSLTPALLGRLTARRMPADDPVTAMVTSAVGGIQESFELFSEPASWAAARAIGELATLLCLHHGESLGLAESAGREEAARALLLFIDEHLTDPELSAEAIAAAHYVSVRKLHRIASEGGFQIASWIRRRRLHFCQRDLADPSQESTPVSEIGARWTFQNPSHFGTIFRREFGVTPAQWRQVSLTSAHRHESVALR